jgi:hypothetical protein
MNTLYWSNLNKNKKINKLQMRISKQDTLILEQGVLVSEQDTLISEQSALISKLTSNKEQDGNKNNIIILLVIYSIFKIFY